MNLNKVFILGNLTSDPELRQIPSGQSVCSFGLATNSFYTDQSGSRQQRAEFHNVVAWGKQGELAHQYLQKGRLALVEGRLQTRSWQDQQGNKKYKTEVVADRIQFGPQRPGEGGMRPGGFTASANEPLKSSNPSMPKPDDTPIIELPGDEEIDVKDIPF